MTDGLMGGDPTHGVKHDWKSRFVAPGCLEACRLAEALLAGQGRHGRASGAIWPRGEWL